MMKKSVDLRRFSLALAIVALAFPARADLLDDDEEAPATVPAPVAPKPETPPVPSDSAPPQKSPKPQKPKKPASLDDGEAPTRPKTPQKPSPASNRPASGGDALAPKGGGVQKSARDADQPVHFVSNGARALREKGVIELMDSVVVTQGSLRLEANQAKVFSAEGGKDVTRVIADGDVKIFKIDEDSGERIRAFGDTAVFDNKTRTVVLDGNARLWRGSDLIRGKRIVYEMDTGWIRADRVAGEVHPRDKAP